MESNLSYLNELTCTLWMEYNESDGIYIRCYLLGRNVMFKYPHVGYVNVVIHDGDLNLKKETYGESFILKVNKIPRKFYTDQRDFEMSNSEVEDD